MMQWEMYVEGNSDRHFLSCVVGPHADGGLCMAGDWRGRIQFAGHAATDGLRAVMRATALP